MSLQLRHVPICLLGLLFISSAIATDCNDIWVVFHNSCYLFAKDTPLSFYEAEHYCTQHGGHLVQLETEAEGYFVKDFLRGMKAQNHWLGLTDERVEGIWEWYHSKHGVTFTDWSSGEPNSYGEQDCGVMVPSYDYKWGDASCSEQNQPICEKEVGQSVIVG